MYEEYWQLETKPFEPAANPQFLFPCGAHQAAIHKLRYAIESRRPAALLVGPAGIGKTLAWQNLAVQLDGALGSHAHLIFPLMTPRDMLTYVGHELGISPTNGQPTLEESIRNLESMLIANREHGKLAVLAVDEAHLLEDAGLLDTLRLLMNLCIGGEPLFTLLLIGQTPALGMMERYNNLDERLEMKVQLKAFTYEETAGYIEHRLVIAGASRPLFTSQALEVAHQLSGGIPRKINRLCDLALMVGFAAGDVEIDAPQLQAVNNELVTLSAAA